MAKKPTTTETTAATQTVMVSRPRFQTIELEVRGTTPLLIHRRSPGTVDAMLAKHIAGSAQSSKRMEKAPKNVGALFNDCRFIDHVGGWDGISCAAIRNALVRSCQVVQIAMTDAKRCLFVVADGFDRTDGTPLVRIHADEPVIDQRIAIVARGGSDVRIRPRYDEWGMIVRVSFDADWFMAEDIVNLMLRAGKQNGIGDGRSFSPMSAGIGMGAFDVIKAGGQLLETGDDAVQMPTAKRAA